MFRKVSLLAALAVSLFAMTGCYFAASSGAYAVRGSYSTSPSASSSVTYDGPHPVFDVNGDEDWCSISGVHTHNYAPDDDTFFVVDSGRYVFVGDPSYYVSNINFNTYNYMGVHPLPVGNGWCYINGPHRHHWASSGYYNYTRVGSYNYYTYYGSRNSYYDPSHKHYDLGTYYASNPPIRYQTTYRTTVGYSRPLPSTNYSYSSGVGNSYTTVRPITSTTTTTRPVVRPSISTGSSSNGSYIRPSTGTSSNGSYIRPSTGGSSNGSYIRPSTGGSSSGNGSYIRPSTGGSSSGNGSFVRPSTGGSTSGGSFVRPSTGGSTSGGSFVRPSTGGSNSGGSFVRPSTGGSSNGSFVRPSTGGSSSGGSFVRPSTGSSSSGGSYVRPSAGTPNRLYPTGKGQYLQQSDEDSNSNGNSNSGTPRRAMPSRP